MATNDEIAQRVHNKITQSSGDSTIHNIFASTLERLFPSNSPVLYISGANHIAISEMSVNGKRVTLCLWGERDFDFGNHCVPCTSDFNACWTVKRIVEKSVLPTEVFVESVCTSPPSKDAGRRRLSTFQQLAGTRRQPPSAGPHQYWSCSNSNVNVVEMDLRAVSLERLLGGALREEFSTRFPMFHDILHHETICLFMENAEARLFDSWERIQKSLPILKETAVDFCSFLIECRFPDRRDIIRPLVSSAQTIFDFPPVFSINAMKTWWQSMTRVLFLVPVWLSIDRMDASVAHVVASDYQTRMLLTLMKATYADISVKINADGGAKCFSFGRQMDFKKGAFQSSLLKKPAFKVVREQLNLSTPETIQFMSGARHFAILWLPITKATATTVCVWGEASSPNLARLCEPCRKTASGDNCWTVADVIHAGVEPSLVLGATSSASLYATSRTSNTRVLDIDLRSVDPGALVTLDRIIEFGQSFGQFGAIMDQENMWLSRQLLKRLHADLSNHYGDDFIRINRDVCDMMAFIIETKYPDVSPDVVRDLVYATNYMFDNPFPISYKNHTMSIWWTNSLRSLFCVPCLLAIPGLFDNSRPPEKFVHIVCDDMSSLAISDILQTEHFASPLYQTIGGSQCFAVGRGDF